MESKDWDRDADITGADQRGKAGAEDHQREAGRDLIGAERQNEKGEQHARPRAPAAAAASTPSHGAAVASQGAESA